MARVRGGRRNWQLRDLYSGQGPTPPVSRLPKGAGSGPGGQQTSGHLWFGDNLAGTEETVLLCLYNEQEEFEGDNSSVLPIEHRGVKGTLRLQARVQRRLPSVRRQRGGPDLFVLGPGHQQHPEEAPSHEEGWSGVR